MKESIYLLKTIQSFAKVSKTDEKVIDKGTPVWGHMRHLLASQINKDHGIMIAGHSRMETISDFAEAYKKQIPEIMRAKGEKEITKEVISDVRYFIKEREDAPYRANGYFGAWDFLSQYYHSRYPEYSRGMAHDRAIKETNNRSYIVYDSQVADITAIIEDKYQVKLGEVKSHIPEYFAEAVVKSLFV
ncbi:MAG: hypothetical protein LBL47_04855 [Lactobacillus sp.]|jgi:hypothetical protein|nr:hypothetical protein [Lactobacillus sp.]